LETLENKVLAVDVSIWLHQVVKGFQDSHGNPLPNAHLLGLFHRICKLLFYKIKPVFVFDGGVPHFKKQTIATRNQHKSKAEMEANRLREQLLKNLVKHSALKQILGTEANNVDLRIRQIKESDMFELPPEKRKLDEALSGHEDDTFSSEEEIYFHKKWATTDLHAVDVSSSQFKSLPADVRHDILSELKETRKQSSWGRLHEMPKESSDFSNYQMTRLLKRRSIQVSLENAEQEMGGHSLSLDEIEEILSEQGVVTNSSIGSRIAADSTTRYVYVKETGKQVVPKSSLEKKIIVKESFPAQTQEDIKSIQNESKPDSNLKAILKSIPHKEEAVEEFEEGWSSDSEEDFVLSEQRDDINLKLAENFMFENSGLTQQQIMAVIQYQNAVEGEIQQDNECLLSPDQPSTSGNRSKEKALVDDSDALTLRGLQDSTAQSSYSQTSVGTTSEVICNRQGVNSVAEVNCIRRGVSSSAEASCSGNGVSNTCDATVQDKWKVNVLNGKTTDEKKYTVREEVSIAQTNDTSIIRLSPVGDKQKDSNNAIEQMTSDSDSDSDTGFVEVTGAVMQPAHYLTSEKKALELIIQQDKVCEIEDDIFSDIFCAQTSEGMLTINSNLPEDTIINPSDNINAGLVGAKNGKFDKENMRNEISGGEEDNKSMMLEEGKELVENIKTQENCTQKDVKPESEVGTSHGVELEEGSKQQLARTTLSSVEPEEDSKKQVTRTTLSSEELQKLQICLEEKHKDLMAERGKHERLAANITDQMYTEAQELLQLFGIPYIIAPMEAEAQCAFLDVESLTDGTITDDSDVWLFGAKNVYKNFFNQKKHVMCFKASDIRQYFKLERQQLVLLGLLVGSDYTPGIVGVGPVTALEILAAFPTGSGDDNILKGLQRFQDWWNGGMTEGSGKTSLKNKLKDIQILEGFPSLAVADAYLHPKVDESKEVFTWGLPDLTALRDFTRQKFGWAKTKTDEILLPVMKKLDERKTQMTLDSYFKVIPKLQVAEGKLSKRVQKAVHRLERVGSSDGEESLSEENKSGHISQTRKKQTLRNLKTRTKNGEAKQHKGRGKNCDSVTRCEQNQPTDLAKTSQEFIPQREQDKINALKRKLKAVEAFHASKARMNRGKRKKVKRLELKEAKLSESSSD
jgi:DNA excision repair protein ERCC-5